MFPAAATIPETLGFAVMGLIGIEAAYPDAKISDVLTPAGLEQTKIVDQKCYGAVLDAFKQPVDQVIAHNPSEVPPFPDIFAADTRRQRPRPRRRCSCTRASPTTSSTRCSPTST